MIFLFFTAFQKYYFGIIYFAFNGAKTTTLSKATAI